MKELSFIITGGGTGGHLAIAKALKDELNRRGVKPVFVGSMNGADREWFEKDKGFAKKYFFNTTGVVDKNVFGKLFALAKIFFYAKKCQKIFEENRTNIVFSVGGYSAAPASIASSWSGLSLYIHEQNSKRGSLNKILSKKAKVVFSSYHDSSPIKDYPVYKEFFDSQRVRGKIKTILFLGGSQGATAINNFAKTVALELTQQNIKIIHQTGKKDYQQLKDFYDSHNIKADVFTFTTQLSKKMHTADFAISRAGASSLWELSANMLPTLFIPYPFAYHDHQYHNAKFLEIQNLTFIKKEDELTKDYFLDLIKKDFTEISTNLKNIIKPDGVKLLLDFIIKTEQSEVKIKSKIKED